MTANHPSLSEEAFEAAWNATRGHPYAPMFAHDTDWGAENTDPEIEGIKDYFRQIVLAGFAAARSSPPGEEEVERARRAISAACGWDPDDTPPPPREVHAKLALAALAVLHTRQETTDGR